MSTPETPKPPQRRGPLPWVNASVNIVRAAVAVIVNRADLIEWIRGLIEWMRDWWN